ncbi:MAG: hypothetical protein HPY66_0277 [Firmicutes bacterium]|nr:hypothetical protein [Bacillota bacterium]MDI6704699.1 hypothetical protein [Bacillota bacterium]
MSVRSVDMQVILQKTAEVMKNQHLDSSKARMQQQQLAQQVQQKTELDGRQVNVLEKTNQPQIRDENKRREKEKKNGRKNDSRENRNGNGKGSNGENRIIDIKI